MTLYIAQASIFSLHASIQTHVQNADLQTKKKKNMIVPYPNVHQTLMMITIRSAHNLQSCTYSDPYQLFMVQL
jgi:hypothetical protein